MRARIRCSTIRRMLRGRTTPRGNTPCPHQLLLSRVCRILVWERCGNPAMACLRRCLTCYSILSCGGAIPRTNGREEPEWNFKNPDYESSRWSSISLFLSSISSSPSPLNRNARKWWFVPGNECMPTVVVPPIPPISRSGTPNTTRRTRECTNAIDS